MNTTTAAIRTRQNKLANFLTHRKSSKSVEKQLDEYYSQHPISKEEFLAMIDQSFADIKAGRVHTWDEVREDTRQKYGF